jgi:hypothetical protein
MFPERCESVRFADEVGPENKQLRRTTSITAPLTTWGSLRVHRGPRGAGGSQFRTITCFRQIAPTLRHRVACAR